jgi:hypothetical protein
MSLRSRDTPRINELHVSPLSKQSPNTPATLNHRQLATAFFRRKRSFVRVLHRVMVNVGSSGVFCFVGEL